MRTLKILSKCGFVQKTFLLLCEDTFQTAAFAVDIEADGIAGNGALVTDL